MSFLPLLVKRFVDLCVLRLEFREEVRWVRRYKDEWRDGM
jgi:hypothetical protein